MEKLSKRTAIKAVLALALCLGAPLAWAAQVAGTVVNLSGPLMVKKLDGSVKVLGVKSEVEQGDTLVSEKNTYAQIRFIDNSEITLRPGTTFKVEAFAYDSARPEADSASFTLIKGGLRSITGLLGKRNREKFEMKTPSATIGIRGTTFIAQWVEIGSSKDAALLPGLHLTVTDGAIMVSNSGGSVGVAAGQFGFVPGASLPPVQVPANPALKFTPPPVFSTSQSPAGGAAAALPKGAEVDCVVR